MGVIGWALARSGPRGLFGDAPRALALASSSMAPASWSALAVLGPSRGAGLAMDARRGLGGRSGDVDVAARATPGDPPTLEALFRAHVDDVHRIVARLLGPGASAADVEDLTQQIFLAVHRALPSFRGDSKPTTWLYGIASRMVITHLRNRRRHRRMIERLESEVLELPRAEPASAERRLAEREELRRVWSCLMELDPRKRVVFMLYELEGLSGKEIAEALELAEATVFTRLYHARRELLARLGALEETR
ncbi:RNA polymerase sigma factor [Myxococcota bacterium]|nr:RNA polymerase sigma factor [Myxococcota bacterium]